MVLGTKLRGFVYKTSSLPLKHVPSPFAAFCTALPGWEVEERCSTVSTAFCLVLTPEVIDGQLLFLGLQVQRMW